jgi:hypothetical protein
MQLPRLEKQTPEDFAALGQGSFSFLCQFPDGLDYTVKIHKSKTRSRTDTWLAELDVFSTDWAFKNRANPSAHASILTLDCPRDQFGIVMYKTVRLLPELLVSLAVAQ